MNSNLDFLELVSSYETATDTQVEQNKQGALYNALLDKNALIWLDNGVSITNKDGTQTEVLPSDNLGLILSDENGKAVNIVAFVKDDKTKTANYEHGAVLMGDITAPRAYLVGGVDDAVQLFEHLDAKGVGKNEPFLIIACLPYHLPKVAKAWQWQKDLIIPINATAKDELLPKLAGVKCELATYVEPVKDIYNDVAPLEVIAQDGRFFYQGGEFIIKDNALYYDKDSDDGENTASTLICGALHIDGRTRDKHGMNWGRLVRFYDDDGRLHTWAMPTSLLHGDSREYRKELASMGLTMNTSSTAKRLLDGYLQHHPNTAKILTVDKVGWHEVGEKMAYVLPHKIWGDGLILQSQHEHGYSTKGTLSSWQKAVSIPINGQHRLMLALCVAMAGVALKPLDLDGMGFHFVGASSMGKSLALKVASSVWGKPKHFIRTWRATANGLESVADLHNDGFLALDEIGQANGKQIGEIVYMLADGQGKNRMSKEGKAKNAKSWRNTILSSGEVSIKQMMNEIGQSTKAGQEIRLAHIRADAGKGLGMFDSLTHTTAHEQATALENAVNAHYGTAGVAWLDYLTANLDKAKTHIMASVGEFLTAYDLSAQQNRVAKRFAIVAGVGELATQIGVTGWARGDATTAVKACFDDWLDSHGNDDLELATLIERINDMIDKHQYSRLVEIEPNTVKSDIHNTPNFLGYIAVVSDETLFCFTNAGFKESIGNLDKDASLDLLKSIYLLKTTKGNKYRLQNGGASLGYFYAIRGKIREFDEN